MTCKDCYHEPVCTIVHDSITKKGIYRKETCQFFIGKSRIVEMPMKATEELRKELTEYCYKRCVDEL